jgi:hypothetical protein
VQALRAILIFPKIEWRDRKLGESPRAPTYFKIRAGIGLPSAQGKMVSGPPHLLVHSPV